MAPRTILLMRHAEKPDDPTSPYLSDAGLLRAGKLAQFIPEKYGNPDFVFAAAEHKKSIRSLLTMTALSDAVAIPLDSSIPAKNYQELAAKLLSDGVYAGNLVVVCWTHAEIPGLVAALGAHQGDYPDPWDDSVFNLILQLDYANNAPPPNVTQVIEPF